MRIRTLNEVIHVVEKAKKDLEKLGKTYPEKYADEFKYIKNSVMDKWYDKYDPFIYDRTGNLYDACKIEFTDTKYNITFEPENLDDIYHRHKGKDSRPYIFENSFVQGYHGGATNGPGHPNPGIPYYRKMYQMDKVEGNDLYEVRLFSGWTRPAVRSFSPYYEMYGQMLKKKKELDKNKNDDIDKIMSRVNKSLSRL